MSSDISDFRRSASACVCGGRVLNRSTRVPKLWILQSNKTLTSFQCCHAQTPLTHVIRLSKGSSRALLNRGALLRSASSPVLNISSQRCRPTAATPLPIAETHTVSHFHKISWCVCYVLAMFCCVWGEGGSVFKATRQESWSKSCFESRCNCFCYGLKHLVDACAQSSAQLNCSVF